MSVQNNTPYMEIPDLDPANELNWQLMHNENGYYECAEGFDAFINEIDDIDVDFNDVDYEELASKLTCEQIYSLAAYNHLVMKYLATISSFSIEEIKELADEEPEAVSLAFE